MERIKQIKTIVPFVLLLLLSGCQKDNINSDGQKFTIMATAASAVNTKTTLGNDLYVSWQKDDAIDIACSNTGETIVQFTADAAGKTVSFSTDNAQLVDFTTGEGKEQYTYYGMYPAVNTYAWDGDEFRTMIPKNQVVTDGCPTKWDVKAAIAAGTCKGDRLIMPFKNAHALVKVVLPQWDTQDFQPISLMLMGRGENDILAADYWVKPNETGLPSLTVIDNPNHVRTVALTSSSYTPQETVYLVVPPGIAHGLFVFLSSTTRTARISTSSNIEFEQNKIYNLDFSGTTIHSLGEPVTCGPHVPPEGNFILVATDGSVAYYQQGTQSGHANTWQSEIFELVNDHYQPYPITNETIRFVEVNDIPQYAIAILSNSNDLIGFLRYDLEWQGSHLIRYEGEHSGSIKPKDVPPGATIYTVYHQEGSQNN